jgi:hypothetical protein
MFMADNGSKLIKKSEELINKTVPTLDASTTGWWRLILIGFAVAASVSAIAIALKYDPNLGRDIQREFGGQNPLSPDTQRQLAPSSENRPACTEVGPGSVTCT